MSTPTIAGTPGGARPVRAVRSLAVGFAAVAVKELRGRMRGRRAFAVVTLYLLLLAGFTWGIQAYLRQQAALRAATVSIDGGSDLALSADIGHAIFTGLLLVLTLLVMVLAPAFTTGAISAERERGTLDLLITTPLSTLGMVAGKLLSALTWVFLLIMASIPVMAVVLVFGGVGPEDLARAYLVLLATAVGMGAVGMFISAITRRTQTATVLSLLVVLALGLGTVGVHELWKVATTETASTPAGFIPVNRSDRAPEALLWLNPFVADVDLVCTTAPGGYQREACDYLASVTGTPFFGSATRRTDEPVFDGFAREPAVEAVAMEGPAPPVAAPTADQPLASFGFPRDTFWPRMVLAYLVLGIVLTLISAQLVAPTRRLGPFRPRAGAAVPTSAWSGGPSMDGSAPPRGTDPTTPDPLDPPLPTDEVTR